MSTVVGVIEEDAIWIGADSQATSPDGERRPIICEKIFRQDDFLIGYIGNVRAGQILKPAFLKFKDDITIIDLPDLFRNQFETFGCLQRADDGSQMIDANFLIACQDGLFEILSDFQLNQVEVYSAIGSGSNFAYGSFYTTYEEDNPCDYTAVEKIEFALNAAAKFDTATAPPFKIYSFELK
jgi:ATP-dependent protease HslVU (ClpYQ) peptidase subunit